VRALPDSGSQGGGKKRRGASGSGRERRDGRYREPVVDGLPRSAAVRALVDAVERGGVHRSRSRGIGAESGNERIVEAGLRRGPGAGVVGAPVDAGKKSPGEQRRGRTEG